MNEKIREIMINSGYHAFLKENERKNINNGIREIYIDDKYDKYNDVQSFIYHCIEYSKYNPLMELSSAGYDFKENYKDFLLYCLMNVDWNDMENHSYETITMLKLLVSLGCDVKKSHEHSNLFNWTSYVKGGKIPDYLHFNIFKILVEYGLDPTIGDYNITSDNYLNIYSENLLKQMRDFWTEFNVLTVD